MGMGPYNGPKIVGLTALPMCMYFVSPAVLPQCFDDRNFKRKLTGNYEFFLLSAPPKIIANLGDPKI